MQQLAQMILSKNMHSVCNCNCSYPERSLYKLTEELLKAVSDQHIVVCDAVHHYTQTVNTTLHNLGR